MLMGELAESLARLEKTSSRNAMTEMLAQLFAEAGTEEVDKICYLVLGRLAPLYERVEFNLAEKMVMRAVGRAFGKEVERVRVEYRQLGDLGEVAHKLKTLNSKLKPKRDDTSVGEVFGRLEKIAEDNGVGSQERKVEGLAKLLEEVDELSAKYIVRVVLGKLRLGFSDKTMLDALSVMVMGSKQAREELEEVYQMYPDVGKIAGIVKAAGVKALAKQVRVTLGVPVLPALCQRLKTADEMIKKMGKVMVEPKYDGTRVQIHFSLTAKNGSTSNNKLETTNNGKNFFLKTFTRNLDETTHMFPELERMGKQIRADEVILDSEAVGVHPRTGELLPFQATITRKRKHGVGEASRQVPLKFFVFDVLYKDGEAVLSKPLAKRRELLEAVIGGSGALEVAPVITTEDAEEIRRFHGKQLAQKLEGVVVKKIDSPYVPGRRGWNWVKFKEIETQAGKLSDTVDAVVMGFYRGKGKRTKFGIGAFLIGLWSEDGRFRTLAKVGTGLTDEQWRELKKRLDEVVSVERPAGYEVDKQLVPDVWVDPAVVVEVAADEVTVSPVHSVGKALRFPRLVRFRDDKLPEQATTVVELERIG